MRVSTAILILSVSVLLGGAALAQEMPTQNQGDLAGRPDHDGDGVPNGQDLDWSRRNGTAGPGWADEDGDGNCDNLAEGRPCASKQNRANKGKMGRGRGGFGPAPTTTTDACGRGRGLPPCGGRSR
jgi:hypothetical protein